jgi:TonB family protein
MRRILVASLLSSFALAAAAATPKPNENPAAATSATEHRVTTGIIAPQLTGPAVVHITNEAALESWPSPVTMRLRLNLDANGSATDVQLLRSFSPTVDADVVAAVRKLRWSPATLDKQPIPLTVNLTVQVEH